MPFGTGPSFKKRLLEKIMTMLDDPQIDTKQKVKLTETATRLIKPRPKYGPKGAKRGRPPGRARVKAAIERLDGATSDAKDRFLAGMQRAKETEPPKTEA